ncbi:LysR substrate-binding domain-containing protein [Rhodospirillaceae bacterium SYSU D60014]|uniref:LysR substrate-binding domain-containing protein n=1 Tax=Virgifigura deserti TaxID=2268457 RepID=UPI000E663526
MERLRSKLPPVSCLLAFEAAGRLANFTLAAAELNVTQAAISRQIRALEEHLRFPVFHRRHRAVQLTTEGRKLHQAVSMGLEHIAGTMAGLRRSAGESHLTIGATIGFAAFWLMPRLTRFRAAFPDIELRLIASDKPLDLLSDGIDIAVRYGSGDWPGLAATYLFEAEIFPVCSPGFLAKHPGLRSPEDLLNLTLLGLDDVDPLWLNWEAWFKEMGLPLGRDPKGNHRRAYFNNYPILIQAAIDGQGVGLGWRYFLDDLLERGALVRPIEAAVRSDLGFYLVVPEGVEPSRDARAFHDWLLANSHAKPDAEAQRSAGE